jgi:hypothetical protein
MSLQNPLHGALRASCALALGLLFASAAGAAPRPLADDEMSAVRGADGSIVAGLQPGSSGTPNALSTGLAAAFASSTGPTLLNAAEFATSLEAGGYSLALMPGYAGESVSQIRVDAKPVTFSFDLSDVLRATTGLSYTGPSMGTITMKDFDARGTTIWAWHHP